MSEGLLIHPSSAGSLDTKALKCGSVRLRNGMESLNGGLQCLGCSQLSASCPSLWWVRFGPSAKSHVWRQESREEFYSFAMLCRFFSPHFFMPILYQTCCCYRNHVYSQGVTLQWNGILRLFYSPCPCSHFQSQAKVGDVCSREQTTLLGCCSDTWRRLTTTWLDLVWARLRFFCVRRSSWPACDLIVLCCRIALFCFPVFLF